VEGEVVGVELAVGRALVAVYFTKLLFFVTFGPAKKARAFFPE